MKNSPQFLPTYGNVWMWKKPNHDLIQQKCIMNEIWDIEGLQKSAEVKKKNQSLQKSGQESFEITTFL